MDKRGEALAVLEQALQDLFRFGDKHLPAEIRVATNDLWRKVLAAQQG